jgi:hypothetical protein
MLMGTNLMGFEHPDHGAMWLVLRPAQPIRPVPTRTGG